MFGAVGILILALLGLDVNAAGKKHKMIIGILDTEFLYTVEYDDAKKELNTSLAERRGAASSC